MYPRPGRDICPSCRKYPAEPKPFWVPAGMGVMVPVKRCRWCAVKEGLTGKMWWDKDKPWRD